MELDAIAARLRDAYQRRDFDALADLLHPDVRWGGPEDTPQTCHSRTDVLSWYRKAERSGVRATVLEARTRPDGVVLTLRVTGRGPGEPVQVRQAFRIVDGLIVDIRGEE